LRWGEIKKSLQLILENVPHAKAIDKHVIEARFPDGKYFLFTPGKQINKYLSPWFLEVGYLLEDTTDLKRLDQEIQDARDAGDHIESGKTLRYFLSVAGFEIDRAFVISGEHRDKEYLKSKIFEPLSSYRLEAQLEFSVLIADAYFADQEYDAKRRLGKTPKPTKSASPKLSNFSEWHWFYLREWHEHVYKKKEKKIV
jgi:hypothetical protein